MLGQKKFKGATKVEDKLVNVVVVTETAAENYYVKEKLTTLHILFRAVRGSGFSCAVVKNRWALIQGLPVLPSHDSLHTCLRMGMMVTA